MAEKSRDFVRLLRRNGYVRIRGHGGHEIYSNGKNTVSFSAHNLNKLIKERLIKENDLT